MKIPIPFTRWLGRELSPKEEAYIDLLERQRRRVGRVRAFVHDPRGELTQVAMEYISWFQSKVDARDALVFTPKRSRALPIPRCFQAAARSFRKHQGKPLCIGQALLFGADAYCPSVPLWRNYFDQIFALASGYLSLPGSILLVHGNIDARRGRSRFARLFRQIQDGEDDFYLTLDATAMELPAISRIYKILFPCERLVARIPVSIFVPYLPRGAPLVA